MASLSFSWSIPSGSVVDRYKLKWESSDCPDIHQGSDDVLTESTRSYRISSGLRNGTSYTVTVIAINSVGNSSSDPRSGTTSEQRERSLKIISIAKTYICIQMSLQLHLVIQSQ